MAARADLNGIKDQIKIILDAANTTTASPIDLSSSMTRRVNRVMSIHPERIQPQASFFPLVTSYIDEKLMPTEDIAGSQLYAKRKAEIPIKVVGAVWNQNMSSVDEDPADEDIIYLMENVELILRSNPNLNSTVTWQRAESVNYYVATLDEQTHLRFGIINLKASVFY